MLTYLTQRIFTEKIHVVLNRLSAVGNQLLATKYASDKKSG